MSSLADCTCRHVVDWVNRVGKSTAERHWERLIALYRRRLG
jgi:hypothetical protein